MKTRASQLSPATADGPKSAGHAPRDLDRRLQRLGGLVGMPTLSQSDIRGGFALPVNVEARMYGFFARLTGVMKGLHEGRFALPAGSTYEDVVSNFPGSGLVDTEVFGDMVAAFEGSTPAVRGQVAQQLLLLLMEMEYNALHEAGSSPHIEAALDIIDGKLREVGGQAQPEALALLNRTQGLLTFLQGGKRGYPNAARRW